MAIAMRSASLLRLGFHHVSSLLLQGPLRPAPRLGLGLGRVGLVRLRCSAVDAGDDGGKKVSARLALTQQVLRDAEDRAASAGSDPAPKITLDHVTLNFARSGGPGGQNVNKVNTKVDMRFNVKEAHWLGERIRERILQTVSKSLLILHLLFVDVAILKMIIVYVVYFSIFMDEPFSCVSCMYFCTILYFFSKSNREVVFILSSPYVQEKNRINKDGELVISSTKTRTQKGNIEDALQKIQAIVDAASYVPPPPSEEQKKKIEKIAAAAERKRLQKKKVLSQKKEFRRNRSSWD